MEVNDAMVDKLANLARLQFNDTEKEGIKTDLQRMIKFVEKLNEVDTTGVEPLLHMSEQVNVATGRWKYRAGISRRRRLKQ